MLPSFSESLTFSFFSFFCISFACSSFSSPPSSSYFSSSPLLLLPFFSACVSSSPLRAALFFPTLPAPLPGTVSVSSRMHQKRPKVSTALLGSAADKLKRPRTHGGNFQRLPACLAYSSSSSSTAFLRSG
eukprot:GHVT01103072.1.p2 GENE.GHVT01103072.1~~GHVT01103072.1.p2  ORF type:complete len:130 (+),score=40.41 GHVT01103072.1:427-816(+)